MPSLIAPRRPLSKTTLPTALSSAKTQTYLDTTVPSTSSTTSSLPGGPSTAAAASNSIRSIEWSPTGSLVATADARVLRVWNPERASVKNSTELKLAPSQPAAAASGGKPAQTRGPAPSHLTGTERVAWNPTREAELASVGNDGVVRFWDVRTRGAMVGEVKVGGEGFSLAWRPDGEDVVVGRKDDTLIPLSRRTLTETGQHPQPVQTNQIAFSNGGDELLVTAGDGQLKVLDFPSMTVLHAFAAHTSSCYVVTPSPRGRHVAVGGSDALVTLWDAADWTCRYAVPDLEGPVRSVSFSFDGSFLTAGSDEGAELHVVHVESGEYVHSIATAAAAPCVAWHPARYWLAYSDPGGLKIVGPGGGSL